MSDVMLLGVLRMPIEYVGAPLSPMAQFVSRAREAADRIEADAAEIERLRAALATESSRKCATEHDCVWQPHCAHAGKCMRPELPFGA